MTRDQSEEEAVAKLCGYTGEARVEEELMPMGDERDGDNTMEYGEKRERHDAERRKARQEKEDAESEEEAADAEANTKAREFSSKNEPSPAKDEVSEEKAANETMLLTKTQNQINHHNPQKVYNRVHQLQILEKFNHETQKNGGRFPGIEGYQHGGMKQSYNDQLK